MNARTVARFVAILIFFLGASMGLPLLAALLYDDDSAFALAISMGVTCIPGLISFLLLKGKDSGAFTPRDGVAVVTLGWIGAGVCGAVPYMISGAVPDFTNAYFESVSGFTTTGATILSDIESLPRGILLWRSMTQWLGGMGIIVLSIAILPFLGVGGMQLYKAEVPSPVVDKLRPRISDTAKILWKVYVLMTVVEILLLAAGGMPLFEALCHAFCTMPTGGFSTWNTSIAHYRSAYFDVVFIVFMLLAGINFSLHYKMIRGDLRVFGNDPECRVFLALVAIFILLVTLDIYGPVYGSLTEAFRHAAFQVSSIITTTGFVTADFDQWPSLSRYVLLLCMFMGGMAGSTAGGIKILRIVLVAKHCRTELFRLIHPHAVTTVKLGKRPVSGEVLSSIWGFFLLYLGLFILASLLMAALGLDLISAFTSVATSIGNVGPGLGFVGPARTFSEVPFLGKWILVFCMLLGRLEIYTVIALLIPEYWRK
jgi:trk system potassium uptake protein TrkH